MKRAILAIAAVVLAALSLKTFQQRLSGPASPIEQRSERRNVLLITLDTTRADRLGAYGYAAARTPHLDALAREGVRFNSAIAQAPITGPSHAAIMTGRYPARGRVRDNATTPLPESETTLAEMLAARGFRTGGFVGAFILDRPYGFAQGFDTFNGGFTRVDSGGETNAERRGDGVVSDAIAWLNGLERDRAFFGWVHLYDPHAPYEGGYDAEIAFVDTQIGRLVDTLRARGLLDSTLIAITGDHGESLGEHGEDEHGVFLYDAVVRVPWIMRGPGIAAGRAIDEQVRTIDLFPTLLEATGSAPAMNLDGESVWKLASGQSRKTIPPAYAESYYPRLHFGWSELRAIRADGWKAIDAPRPEIYNLRDDPGETRNLYASQQALADRMIADAARMDRDMAGGAAAAVAQPDRETLERLRSLGYVGAAAAPLKPGERGPDPKDHIAARRRYSQTVAAAIANIRAGRPEAAVAPLQALAREHTRAHELHELLGEAYQKQGRLNEALGEYELAAMLNARAAGPRLSAAEVELARRDVAGARRQIEQALAIDSSSFDTRVVLGRVLEAEGLLAEAMKQYELAIAANAANPRPRMLMVGLATRLKRNDIAEAQLRALLAMNYQPSRTHVALGQLAQMRGATAEAADHYREALRLEPGLTMAQRALAALRQ